MRRSVLGARHEFRFGTREIIVLSATLLLTVGLAFGFGILVGRELDPANPAPGSLALATNDAPSGSEAESGAESEPPAAAEERLTFYETLTAPTPSFGPLGQPAVEERLVPRGEAVPPPPLPPPRKERHIAAPRRTSADPAPNGDSPPPETRRPRPAQAPTPPSRPNPPAEPRVWTVQVSSFRSRALAEELKARLDERGFDVYLVTMSTDEGRVRHRVRVGRFGTRAEAEQIAAQLRSERNLNPFVTTRTR